MRIEPALRVQSSLRAGSSWPVVLETGSGRYYTKLSGSGGGYAALVAEVVTAQLAEAIGLHVPARCVITIDGALPSENRDPELLELIARSQGVNLGFAEVEQARDFRPEDVDRTSADDATRILWLDWLVMNPDRTAQNPNLLIRRGQVWLIDHGSSLVFQHNWQAVTEDAPTRPWTLRVPHLFSAFEPHLLEWHVVLREIVDLAAIREAVMAVPVSFLKPLVQDDSADGIVRRREAYIAFLWKRIRSRPGTQAQTDESS